ncbi:hypothetical protein [Streptomyces sp. NPDC001604]|uniref:hypothetical protein n=1 Tax=Streptomyces sp. NPDC001604 TaxID=3364593 RepID=UPI0036B4D60A
MTGTTTALEPLVASLAATAPGLRVETGSGATGPHAHDASNYRLPPRAVAYPRSAADVVAVLRACSKAGVPVTARVAASAWQAMRWDSVSSWTFPST